MAQCTPLKLHGARCQVSVGAAWTACTPRHVQVYDQGWRARHRGDPRDCDIREEGRLSLYTALRVCGIRRPSIGGQASVLPGSPPERGGCLGVFIGLGHRLKISWVIRRNAGLSGHGKCHTLTET
eukprot:1677877-Prymnesium_polylepis.1